MHDEITQHLAPSPSRPRIGNFITSNHLYTEMHKPTEEVRRFFDKKMYPHHAQDANASALKKRKRNNNHHDNNSDDEQ